MKMLSQMADRDLVEIAQQGDAEAFDELMKRYYPRILGLCIRAGLSREDAEDVVVLTFENAWRSMHLLKSRDAFPSWVNRIAIHNLSHLISKKARSSPLEVSLDDAAQAGAVETGVSISEAWRDNSDPLTNVLSAELHSSIADAIERLNPKQQEAIRLWLQGANSKEIAAHLNIRVSATNTTIFRAKRKLADILTGKNISPDADKK